MRRGRRRGRGVSSTKLRERVYRWRRGYAGGLKGRFFEEGVNRRVGSRLVRNGERLERATCGRAPAVPLVSPG